MRIQHNIMAMNSYRNYNNNASALSGNLEKLSSGYKINRAGDDAAGLAISEKMRAQIAGLDQAQRNVDDGISLIKTAEGALQEVQDMLNRMVTLAEQSANGTYDNNTDRANLQKEMASLQSEIDRISDSANFNGIKLLDGTQSLTTDVAMTNSGTASITLSVTSVVNGETVQGSDLNGMSVQIGSKVYSVKYDSSATATGIDNGVLTITSDTETLNNVMTWIANDASTKVYAEDESGTRHALTVAYSAGSGLVITGPASKEMDFSTMPTVSVNRGLLLQIGDTSATYNQLRVNIGNMNMDTLLGGIDLDISKQEDASDAINYIKFALNTVSAQRGDLGAAQNRLEHTANNLSVMEENIQNAESAIRDTDIADEMTAYTKNNILLQSAQAMLAQANSVPQGVLSLLQ